MLDLKTTHAKCWAHAMRYFYDSVPLDSNKKMITNADGYTRVKYIDELFKIEKEIKYLIETLPQLEGEKTDEEIEKYLPWSRELPEEILNYEGTYEDIKIV